MSGKYVSDKPDGYMRTRNNVYLERETKLQDRTFREQGALRNLPPQSKKNYGKNDLRIDKDR